METKAERRQKLVDRIYARAMAKNSEDERRRYILAAIGNMGAKGAELIARLPLPLAQSVRIAMAERADAKQRKTSAATHAIQQAEKERKEVALARWTSARERLAELTGHARIVFLAGLPVDEREHAGTAAERKEAIALRKTAIMAGKVRAALGCTETELDRWNADGRLPHLYVRTMHFEKATPCRFWDAAVVDASISNVAVWRQQDGIKKQFKRRGLRSVASNNPSLKGEA